MYFLFSGLFTIFSGYDLIFKQSLFSLMQMIMGKLNHCMRIKQAKLTYSKRSVSVVVAVATALELCTIFNGEFCFRGLYSPSLSYEVTFPRSVAVLS